MPTVKVLLNPDERNALRAMAQEQLRDPRAQAAWLIRRELEQRGYLRPDRQPVPAGPGGHRDSS